MKTNYLGFEAVLVATFESGRRERTSAQKGNKDLRWSDKNAKILVRISGTGLSKTFNLAYTQKLRDLLASH